MDKDQLLLEQAYDQIRPTQVTVYGINYTGAHFRGIPDPTDEREVKIVLRGSDKKIVDYILENFSYGQTEPEIESLKDMIEGYKTGNIANGDGCGMVIVILDARGKEILNTANDFNMEGISPFNKFIDLGVENADDWENSSSDVNGKLKDMEKAGTLPPRPEGEGDDEDFDPAADLDENDEMDTDV